MKWFVGIMQLLGATVLLLAASFSLPGSPRAEGQIQAWWYDGDQLIVTGPRELTILDKQGERTVLALDGDLAAVHANPTINVALVLTHDAAAFEEEKAELGFEPVFFECEARLLTVPEGRWLPFPVTGNNSKMAANACGPHLAAAFSSDGKYTLLADHMQVAPTADLIAALKPAEAMQPPPAPIDNPIQFDDQGCGGVVDFGSFYWRDDTRLGFDYGACGNVLDVVFDAAEGSSRVSCNPARQKEGYDCPASLMAE